MAAAYSALRDRIEAACGAPKTVYLDLPVKRVRLLVYSEEFEPHIRGQLPYILRSDGGGGFDATVVLWKETEPDAPDILREYDRETETWYYGVKDLEYEEFIKQGHFLVQILYQLLNTPRSSLVHAAAVGTDGEGVLLCARGQRGKSTLSVLAMYMGMEYVSDDYLLLEREEDGTILASPIYSIITLSPTMTERLGERLSGAVRLGWNARKDKHVFNIASMHGSFRTRYPIRALVFPEILDIEEPFLREAAPEERGRAVAQLLHSTAMQMDAMRDSASTRKLLGMVTPFDCWYIGLSRDIEKNAALLKEFVQKRGYRK